MNTIIYFLIGFLIFIFIYNILSTNVEGMDTKTSCDSDIQTTVYKNAGTISNLQDSINDIMKQINTLTTDNNKQNIQISNMSKLQDKYDKIAQEADKIAKTNQAKILQAVQSAKQKGSDASNAQKKLAPI